MTDKMPTAEGQDVGERCNRNGCAGEIHYGVVGAILYPRGHSEINGWHCPVCEWNEADFDD